MKRFTDFICCYNENLKLLKSLCQTNEKVKPFIDQVLYLEKLIKSDGAFFDPTLKSPLDFQYHYSFFCISALLLYELKIIRTDIKKIIKIVDYWSHVPDGRKIASTEFNNFSFCLAYWILIDIETDDQDILILKKKIKNIINNLHHRDLLALKPLNNNFTALAAINLFLDGSLNQDRSKIADGKKLMKNNIIDFQMEDGFFPDSNMTWNHEMEKNNGLPHLTYHVKIAMVVALYAILSNDENAKKASLKAFNNIIEIAAPTGEACFYGRTTNSLYSYATLFLGLCITYKYIKQDIRYYKLLRKILNLVLRCAFPDGHFSINLNASEDKRPGYDGYMYPVVYNAYANSLFLLGFFIFPQVLSSKNNLIAINNQNNMKNVSRVTTFANSGFCTVQDQNLQFTLNLKGHLDCPKHFLDPRVAPLSLLYLNYRGNDIIPAIPYRPQLLSRLVSKPSFIKILKNLKEQLVYDLSDIGFIPCFVLNKSNLYLFTIKDLSIDEGHNKIHTKYSLISVNKKNIGELFRRLKRVKKNSKRLMPLFEAEIVLSWRNNKISYMIEGPAKSSCIFPIRIYESSQIRLQEDNSIVIKYKNNNISILTNKPFRLDEKNKLSSNKGWVKMLYLRFPESNALNIVVGF